MLSLAQTSVPRHQHELRRAVEALDQQATLDLRDARFMATAGMCARCLKKKLASCGVESWRAMVVPQEGFEPPNPSLRISGRILG